MWLQSLRRWPLSNGSRASSRWDKETASRNYYNTSLVSASRIFRYYYWSARTDIKVIERPLSMFTPLRPKNHEITDNRPPCGDALLTSSAIYIITPSPNILCQHSSMSTRELCLFFFSRLSILGKSRYDLFLYLYERFKKIFYF